MSLAPLRPKFRQRRRVRSLGAPSRVPSQPSMGRMQKRLPTARPSASRGRARGEEGGAARTSSSSIASPLLARCPRKASAVLKEATRGHGGSLIAGSPPRSRSHDRDPALLLHRLVGGDAGQSGSHGLLGAAAERLPDPHRRAELRYLVAIGEQPVDALM